MSTVFLLVYVIFRFFPKVRTFKGMIHVVFPPQRWGGLGWGLISQYKSTPPRLGSRYSIQLLKSVKSTQFRVEPKK